MCWRNTTQWSERRSRVTLEVASINGVTLNDDDAWIEVQSLGPTGSPSGVLPSTFTTDAKADVLQAAAAQTTSLEAWTGAGCPLVTQKLAVTVTPQESGYLMITACFARASNITYLCPKVSVA